MTTLPAAVNIGVVQRLGTQPKRHFRLISEGASKGIV